MLSCSIWFSVRMVPCTICSNRGYKNIVYVSGVGNRIGTNVLIVEGCLTVHLPHEII